jgi:alkylation response protein AidB-like acyl-CoA dehydrogenase
MDFGLSDEQRQLDDAELAWLTRFDPVHRLRSTLDIEPVTIDRAAITHAAESGFFALLTPEMGGNHIDLAVLTERHGYAASSLPIADAAIATWLLDRCEAPQAAAAKLGKTLYGLTVAPATPSAITPPIPMLNDLDGVVVLGASEHGEYAVVVESPDRSPISTLDLTRTWGRMHVELSDVEPIALPAGTVAVVRDALAVHRAFDALGAASRLLDMTVTYAGQRHQFGVPIGSFQAVKHHCANMTVGVEAGRSVLWAAALALDAADPQTRPPSVSAAAAFAKAASSEVAGTALQVHGGIGFTWEHDLHLFMRRIKVDEAMNGTVAEHRRALVPA